MHSYHITISLDYFLDIVPDVHGNILVKFAVFFFFFDIPIM